MTEYWLQKKTIGGWSHVTWYASEQEARANFDRINTTGQSGYSWRLCKVEIVEQHLLEEVVKVEAPEVEQMYKANVWGGQAKATVEDWSNPPNKINAGKSAWNDLPSDSSRQEHGMTGKIWVVHHQRQIKKRVDPSELEEMLSNGYERGGPKTAFRT